MSRAQLSGIVQVRLCCGLIRPLREKSHRLVYLHVFRCPRSPHSDFLALAIFVDVDFGGNLLLLALGGAYAAVEVAPLNFHKKVARVRCTRIF